MSVKAAALAAITQDAFLPLWRSLTTRDQVVVLMMHRFADRERGIRGDLPEALRANLELLRRHRFHLGSLGDFLGDEPMKAPAEGPTVVFTVDDGYADFARIGAPIFAEFDCPVTTFVVTDAIDQKAWFWWDKVEFILDSSVVEDVGLELSTGRIQARRVRDGSAEATVRFVVEELKRVPDAEKEGALATLAETMGVEVPAVPPPRYAAMTWTEVQRCADAGATFAPHTLRHPMLTMVDAGTAEREILGSWARLQENCSATVPVFCFPNGSFTRDHIDVLARSTMRAAVSTVPRYATGEMFVSPDPSVRFAIPRFVYSGVRDRFVQVVAGVERMKTGVRDALRGLMPD
jgi:peptidoglycan/xylan/chitin deacetylase (PgdA/CDA1 family)